MVGDARGKQMGAGLEVLHTPTGEDLGKENMSPSHCHIISHHTPPHHLLCQRGVLCKSPLVMPPLHGHPPLEFSSTHQYLLHNTKGWLWVQKLRFPPGPCTRQPGQPVGSLLQHHSLAHVDTINLPQSLGQPASTSFTRGRPCLQTYCLSFLSFKT